jgi:hypothetical protein
VAIASMATKAQATIATRTFLVRISFSSSNLSDFAK